MNTSRTRFVQNGPVVILIMIALLPTLMCTFYFISSIWGALSRPMFHEWVGLDDRFRLWAPISPITDKDGNFGYFDGALNVLVIVMTNNPEHYEHITPASNSSTRARLLPGTQYEVIIEDKKEALIIVCPGGVHHDFRLLPGEARTLWDELIADSQATVPNLIEKVALTYQGPDRSQLVEFVQGRKVKILEENQRGRD